MEAIRTALDNRLKMVTINWMYEMVTFKSSIATAFPVHAPSVCPVNKIKMKRSCDS